MTLCAPSMPVAETWHQWGKVTHPRDWARHLSPRETLHALVSLCKPGHAPVTPVRPGGPLQAPVSPSAPEEQCSLLSTSIWKPASQCIPG